MKLVHKIMWQTRSLYIGLHRWIGSRTKGTFQQTNIVNLDTTHFDFMNNCGNNNTYHVHISWERSNYFSCLNGKATPNVHNLWIGGWIEHLHHKTAFAQWNPHLSCIYCPIQIIIRSTCKNFVCFCWFVHQFNLELPKC